MGVHISSMGNLCKNNRAPLRVLRINLAVAGVDNVFDKIPFHDSVFIASKMHQLAHSMNIVFITEHQCQYWRTPLDTLDSCAGECDTVTPRFTVHSVRCSCSTSNTMESTKL